MTEWEYPGDEFVREAFAANVAEALTRRNVTPEEAERRIAEAQKTMDFRAHDRAFGRAVRKLRQERNQSRKSLAITAQIPVKLVTDIERGRSGDISVPVMCRIACALKVLPDELMEQYGRCFREANDAG